MERNEMKRTEGARAIEMNGLRIKEVAEGNLGEAQRSLLSAVI
jgi:hypothetical protein